MDKAFSELDHAQVRRQFARAAATYDGAAVLAREVERRMLERLDYVKFAPARILDAGCGHGAGLRELGRRYPGAQLLGVDATHAMLRGATRAATLGERARALIGRGGPRFIGADMRALPLADASCGLVWSNFGLAFAGEPQAALREFARVLEPGGLLMFSAYGPDTLRELRWAFSQAEEQAYADAHVHDFTDMHDLGDMLAGNGFAPPVMDMEMLTLTYADVNAMARDLRASGQTNALASRRRGLTGKSRWQRMAAAYEGARARDGGPLPASFEVVYGHAWKGAPRTVKPAVVKLDLHRHRES
jgi:malonyl-CoA O-methyltransferase